MVQLDQILAGGLISHRAIMNKTGNAQPGTTRC